MFMYVNIVLYIHMYVYLYIYIYGFVYMYIFICVYVHCFGILPAPSGATGSDTGDVLAFLMKLQYHLCLPTGRFSICRNPEPLRAPELPCVCARCRPPPNAKGMDRAAAFPVARNLFERRSYRVTCHNIQRVSWSSSSSRCLVLLLNLLRS